MRVSQFPVGVFLLRQVCFRSEFSVGVFYAVILVCVRRSLFSVGFFSLASFDVLGLRRPESTLVDVSRR